MLILQTRSCHLTKCCSTVMNCVWSSSRCCSWQWWISPLRTTSLMQPCSTSSWRFVTRVCNNNNNNSKKPALTRVQRPTLTMFLWLVTLIFRLLNKWFFQHPSWNISVSSLVLLTVSVFRYGVGINNNNINNNNNSASASVYSIVISTVVGVR